MDGMSLARLLLLSAIWGASFLFMRIAVSSLGPVVLMASRVGLAACFLWLVARLLQRRLQLGSHWKHYLVLGLFNSALPFLLFAYAAQTLTASLLSILNATAPIWGALIGALWRGTRLSRRRQAGLLLGIGGVVLLLGLDPITLQPGASSAVLAALGAAFSYGIASTYAHGARSVEPFANAHGSMWAALLLIMPLVPFFPQQDVPSDTVILAVLTLGVLCSGVAYLIYFRLIADQGPASALTVTFLIPLFGVLFGALLLDEVIGWHTLSGCLVIILGTSLVTGFNPRQLWMRK